MRGLRKFQLLGQGVINFIHNLKFFDFSISEPWDLEDRGGALLGGGCY